MGAPQLSDGVRRRLLALLADEASGDERLIERLGEVRRQDGVPACSAALHLLARLQLAEPQAERLLAELAHHRKELERVLGRDPGLRVAAIDYLSNVSNLLAEPAVVEQAELERNERSAPRATGPGHRRHFDRALARELRRSQRHGLVLSLLLVDLDSSESGTERYGPPFGDAVLQCLGPFLRRAVRETDVACRFDGEEFAVILPDTDRLGAYTMAERVRAQVERAFAQGSIAGRPVVVRLSGGLAAYPADGGDAAELIERASQALHRSKNQGENRITLYHSEKRNAVRYPARAGATLGLIRAREAAATACAVNFSRTGALLEIEHECQAREAVELALPGGVGSKDWLVAGCVVRVEPRDGAFGYRVAVAFERPLPELCLLRQIERVARVSRGGPA